MNTMTRTLALLALILSPLYAGASNIATQHSYIGGGLQYSHMSHEFTSGHYSSDNNEQALTASNMAGAYLNGSWNFTHQLYLMGKIELSKRNQMSIAHHMAALGYFQPVTDSLSLFTALGVSQLNLKQDGIISHPDKSHQDSGLGTELGVRLAASENWLIEPAFRLEKLGDDYKEYRLGNVFSVSNHMNLEANLTHATIAGYSMTNYQVGIRYTF